MKILEKPKLLQNFLSCHHREKKFKKKIFEPKFLRNFRLLENFFIISEIRFLKFQAIVEKLKMAILPKPAKKARARMLELSLG